MEHILSLSILNGELAHVDEQYVIGTKNGYISMNLNSYDIVEENFTINRIEANSINSDPIILDLNDNLFLDYETNNI